MVLKWTLVCLTFVILCTSSPTSLRHEFWKGTPLDVFDEKMKLSCEKKGAFACIQLGAVNFLDNLLSGNFLAVSDDAEGNNTVFTEVTARLMKNNIQKPVNASAKTKPLDQEKKTLRTIGSDTYKGRKKHGGTKTKRKHVEIYKYKKWMVPILTVLVLKIITFVPLALGVLGLKAWNGLQLALLSFFMSSALTIYQISQKMAASSSGVTAHAHINAQRDYDVPHVHTRHEIPYSAYGPPT